MTPHERLLARAERRAAVEQERYAKTRSRVAEVRMRDAVTKALRCSSLPLLGEKRGAGGAR